MKKTICFLLTLSLLICSFSFLANAENDLPDYSMEWDEWVQYCGEFEGSNTLISLTPGADETQMEFAWHSDFFSKKPVIRISKNADMSDYTEFSARFTFAENLKQKVNKATATGLEANTCYYYTYGTDHAFSEPVMFKTLSPESFKVFFVSDIQCNSFEGDTEKARQMAYNWQCNLANALNANEDISFILSAGDQTHHGLADEWMYTLSPKALRSLPMATTVGNHDNKTTLYNHYVNNPNTYLGTTPSLTGNDYWFRYGDVLFMSFNANNENIYDHFNFAKEAVMQNTDAKWRVGMLHHDFYGTGGHADNNENIWLRAEFCPIADIFEFDIMLTGHEHIYGRSYYMYNGEIVENEGYENGNVTDPQGTIYFTASAASDNCRVYDEPYDFEWLAFTILNQESIYSTMEFDSYTLSINSYFCDTNEQVDEFNIEKSDTSFADTSEVTFGDYFNEAVEQLCGDYFFIVELLQTIIGTIMSMFC